MKKSMGIALGLLAMGSVGMEGTFEGSGISGTRMPSSRKSILNNSQKKERAKSKRARKARRINR